MCGEAQEGHPEVAALVHVRVLQVKGLDGGMTGGGGQEGRFGSELTAFAKKKRRNIVL